MGQLGDKAIHSNAYRLCGGDNRTVANASHSCSPGYSSLKSHSYWLNSQLIMLQIIYHAIGDVPPWLSTDHTIRWGSLSKTNTEHRITSAQVLYLWLLLSGVLINSFIIQQYWYIILTDQRIDRTVQPNSLPLKMTGTRSWSQSCSVIEQLHSSCCITERLFYQLTLNWCLILVSDDVEPIDHYIHSNRRQWRVSRGLKTTRRSTRGGSKLVISDACDQAKVSN